MSVPGYKGDFNGLRIGNPVTDFEAHLNAPVNAAGSIIESASVYGTSQGPFTIPTTTRDRFNARKAGIAVPPAPFAYYKMDDLSGAEMVGGRNLTYPPNTTYPGQGLAGENVQLITGARGNAVLFKKGVADGLGEPNGNLSWGLSGIAYSADTGLNMVGTSGFTVRFCFDAERGSASNFEQLISELENGTNIPVFNARPSWFIWGHGIGSFLEISVFYWNESNPLLLDDSVDVAETFAGVLSFQHVVCWVDNANLKIGIRINAGPLRTADIPAPIETPPDADGMRFQLCGFPPAGGLGNNTQRDNALDEIAIWKNYVLSEAEMDYDYNDGYPRTWNGTDWLDGRIH